MLRGAAGQLAHVDAVYVEINYKPMYEGCLLIDAIDALLLDAGLTRVETHCAHSPNWGDALYLRLPRSVTMSTLGSNGRFGNQIFQYAWLAALCDEHGLRSLRARRRAAPIVRCPARPGGGRCSTTCR